MVLNHPNALLDPLFVLCHSPRPASFLAKSTLFNMPVISFLTRAFGSVPVYRREDNAGDTSRNTEMFRAARELLATGGVLALFPEGVSHDDSKLKPLKTGAARIALSAANLDGGLRIQPAGLYYLSKTTFRSSALVVFGDPIDVAPVDLDPTGSPTREDVAILNETLKRGLDDVTIQADQHDALDLIARVERMFSAASRAEDAAAGGPLTQLFARRRRLLDGYNTLRHEAPETLAILQNRLSTYEQDLVSLGLDHEHLSPAQFTASNVLTYGLKSFAWLAFLGPFALLGVVLYGPAYLAIDHIAHRASKGEDDMLATLKILGAMLFFPLTWLLVLVPAFVFGGLWVGLSALLAMPCLGLAVLWFRERFESFAHAARGLVVFMRRKDHYRDLCREREAICAEISALGDSLAEQP